MGRGPLYLEPLPFGEGHWSKLAGQVQVAVKHPQAEEKQGLTDELQ